MDRKSIANLTMTTGTGRERAIACMIFCDGVSQDGFDNMKNLPNVMLINDQLRAENAELRRRLDE